MTKVLFVCSANRDRSATAERIYSDHPGIEVKSAGTLTLAKTPLSVDLVQWSDIIFTMEYHHQQYIEMKYGDIIAGKTLVCLHIQDKFPYMHEFLIDAIKGKVDKWLIENNIL